MKSLIGVFLLGALACVLAEGPEATVEVEPEYDLYGMTPAPGFNATSSHFTCGDHNCTEMDMLESILLSLNLFTPSDDIHPHYSNPPPHTHRPTCCDSQNMILKVAALLHSVSDLLSLCGSPQFCCQCHHYPTPMAHSYSHSHYPHPTPNHPDSHFGSFEADEFDRTIDDIVSVLIGQIKEEMGEAAVESEVEAAVNEVEKEMKKEEEKQEEKEEEKQEEKEEEKQEEKEEEKQEEKEEEKPEETATVTKSSEERDEPKKSRKKGSKKEAEEKEKSAPAVSLMDVLNMSR